MPTIPAYTINGLTRPELHLDSSGNIVLDPVAEQFAATYGLRALYLGVPSSTPYPPVPASLTTPADVNGSANSVAEGAVAGTAVGITASATTTTGQPVIYTLTADSSHGGFAINPTTGVVTVSTPAKVDFEGNPGHSYSITVQASDGILTSSQSFTIGVSNVAPTTPVDANAAANSVAEGAAVGTAVGITASSADVNGPGVTWTLSTDSSGGGFAIDANGVITVADSSKIDYETAAGHAYTVTARASDGALTGSQIFTIAVSDVPVSTPRDSDAAVNSVAEGAAAGTAVGVTASAVDPNGPASTYTLTGDTSFGGFTIDSTTGVVTVANASKIDFETAAVHAYTVTALATNGTFTSSQAFTIAVSDVAPSTPTDGNNAANIVVEGAGAGTVVGVTAFSTDINGPAVIYSFADIGGGVLGNAGGRFAIDSGTGIVTVANSAAIDFETATGHSYSVSVKASDGTLTSAAQTFAIAVSDVAPSAPTDSNNAANTIVEGAGAGTLVGVTAASTDINGPAVIYSFADIGGGVLGDAGGRFQIDSATGEVRVSALGAASIDYESAAGHAYSVTLQASDGTLTSAPQILTIAVTNVAPSTPADGDALNLNGVTEGAAGGTYTGLTAASSDTNGGTVTYSLTDTAGGRFSIDSGSGAVSIANPGLIDFESSGGSYSITVQASDGTNATSQDFTIAVANAAPSIPTDSDAGTADIVTEGVASGVYIGLTAASTDINGPAVTWTLTDDAGGRFAIDPASGAVTTGPNANLIDFETSGGTSTVNGSYSITAQASDGAGGIRSQTFAIAVTDAPPASWSDEDGGANTILEGAANGTQVGVIAHAVDPNGGAVTYSLAVNPNGAFAIDASSGIVTVADSTKIDFESTAGHQYTLTVQGTDASGHFTTNNFVVDVTDAAPSAPTDTDTAVGGPTDGVIAEGAAQFSTVGITAHSFDVNGPAVTYSLSNDAGGLFTIDAASGVVSVTAAGAIGIDYEGTVAAGHTYAITVEASDGTLSASQNFTIGVTNAAPSQPTDSNGAVGGSIQANAADNTPVGITLASTDTGGGAVTYSITDPSGAFAVDPNTGVVALKTGHPALNPGTNYTITAVASDGATTSAPQTFNIFVSNNALNVDLDGNDSGGVVGNGYAAAFTEQGSAVPITDTDDVITNTGSPGVTNATSATIVLTNAQAGDSLLVNGVLPGGIGQTTTTGSGQITITLSGTASYASYQAALHQIQFSTSGDAPNTTPRTINVTVTDSTGSSPVAVSTITVTSVNDAPALNGAAAAVSYTENDGPTALFAAGSVADPDAPANFAGGSYTVAIGNAATGDQIVLLGTSGFSAVGTSIVFGSSTIGTIHTGTGLGTSSVTIDLNSSATPAVVSALAHAFGFQNSSDNPSTLNRTVTFAFNDGNNSHTDIASTAKNSNVVTQTVQVIAVNDAPTAANDTAAPQAEDTGAPWTILGSSLTANDVTGPSGLNETGQTLTVISTSNAIGGSVSVVTGNVVFTPTADFNGTASFDYTVQDNGQTNGVNDFKTATGHVTFNVREVNDAPTAANDTLFDIAEDSGARTIAFAALTGNDSAGPADEAGQTLTVSNVTNPIGGTVQIISGNVIFTPTADFNGAASFDYTVEDNGTTGGAADFQSSATAGHVTFNVTAVNDAPVTVADALTSVTEDSATRTILFTDLTGNDTGPADEAAQTLTVIGVSNAVGGTVAIFNGHVEFTPTPNFNGTASFDYTVQDNGLTNGASDPKTSIGHASFDVTEINDAPVAVDDTLSAIATSATPTVRIITFAALTGNDSPGPANEAAQALTVSAVAIANPQHGTVVINNGHVEFTPDANFVGTASFDYTVTDDGTTDGVSAPKSNTGHVSFEVAAIALDLDSDDSAATGNNYAVLVTSLATPIAIADVDTSIIDSTSLTPISTATITITGGFVSGDTLAFAFNAGTMGDITVGASTAGVLTLTSAGGATADQWQAALHALTYDPGATPTSTADRTITVVVGDGAVTSNTAITTVHFDANDAPAAGDDTLSAVAEDSSLRTIQFAELTANDSPGPANESGQTLTVTGVSNAVGGMVEIANGHVEFTPTANFNGTASFDYTVQDNGTTLGNPDPKTDVGHVSFTVTAINDAPTAAADTLTPVAEDSGIATIAFSDLTGNDSAGPTDEAGQTLTVTAVSNAVGGTVAIVNGHVEFTPSANFNGAASFDYTVQDNGTTNGASDPKTAVGHATIAVSEVNDVPVAAADTLTAVAEDSGIDIVQFTELTANDSAGPANESAQTLTVTAVSNAVGGSVEIVNGHVEFTPAANFNGTASFDYTVEDNGTSAGVLDARAALGHATIAVSAVNDAPVLDLNSTDAPGNKDFTAAYTVSATPVAIAPATVSITDVDDSNVTSATVTLTNAQTNDVLAISDALPGGISAVITPGAGTITVSLSGSATLAQYQAALHQIVFSNGSASPDPTTLDRIVTVVVGDGHGVDPTSNIATTTIHLTQDTPPVANPKAALANEAGGINNGTAGSDGSGNVITDAVTDSDAENPVSALVVSAFSHGANPGTPGSSLAGDFGTLTLNAGGSYSYAINNANTTVQALRLGTDTLTDSFNYTIRDTAGLTTSSTLTITIHGANDNPVAVNETSTAIEAGTSAGVNPGGNVLTNDTDVDSGDSKILQGVAAGTQVGPLTSNVGGVGVAGSFGTLTIAADGTYSYVVNNANTSVQALRTSAQTLTDTFSYTVHDAANATSTAQVTVTIQGQNDAPVASADTATATEAGGTNNGTAGTNISNFNVLTGVGTGSVADTDPDSAANGETRTVQGVETGAHPGDAVTTGVGSPLAGSFGTLTLNSNGSYSYTVDNSNPTVNALNNGAHVNDVFTYTMHDTAGATSTTTLNIQVNGANDAPVGVADSAVVFLGRATTPSINLLANDTDIDTAAANLTAVKDTNPAHGSVTVNANGSFTYTGNAGYLGADSFTYHVADNGSPNLSSASVTVTLDVQPLVWHIDNTAPAAGEDGSAAHPFHSIAAFNAANAGANSLPDIIYLHNGTGTYTEADGFNLKNGQTLLGQGVDLTYQTSASAPGGAHIVTLLDADNTQIPTIVATAGDGIDLAQNNTVQGLHIGNASGVGISDGGGTVGTLNISGVDINSTGQAIDIDQGGTLNVSLSSVTSSGGAQGIQLGGALTGSFAVTSGTLSGHTGSEFDITGGAGTISYGGTIGDGSGLSASIANRTGGSVTLSGNINDGSDAGGGITVSSSTGTIAFTGATKTLNTGASDAVALTSNNGAIINFTNGGLDIDTTSGRGFTATGAGPAATTGGTITVTGNGNHLTSTTGTALNINNTTIGSSNVTFQDISASGGTAAGIILDTTGASGGLIVQGNGATAGAGGTIANKTGGDITSVNSDGTFAITGSAGTGIYLNNTSNVSLNGMNLHDFTNFAILGNTVNGLTIDHMNVNGTNGGNALLNEGAIAFQHLTGTANASNSTFSGGLVRNFSVINTNNESLNGITFNTVTFGKDSNTLGSDALFLQARNTATLNATITGSTFLGSRGDMIQLDLTDSAHGNLTLSGSTLNNTSPSVTGGGGITLSGGGSATSNVALTYDIENNIFSGARGDAILVALQTGAGSAIGKIIGNTIGVAGTDKSGSSEASAIEIRTVGRGAETTQILNNNIHQYSNFGILLQMGDQNVAGSTGTIGDLNATVTGNTIDSPSTTVFSKNGVQVNLGTTTGDTYVAYVDISNNNAANSGSTDTSVATDYVLRQRQATTLDLKGYLGANSDNAAVIAFIQAQNIGTETVFAANTVPTGGGFGNTPAGKPILLPLVAAAGGVQPSSTPSETHDLTKAELDSAVEAAIGLWKAASASDAQLAALHAITFSVDNLAGDIIGDQGPGAYITIDTNAAGHGWFVDTTPNDNSEFTHAQNAAGTDLLTDPSNAAAGHLDLLTTVVHEMGHVLGLPDLTAAADAHDLMYIDLVDGERRLPDPGDVPVANTTPLTPNVALGPVVTPGNDTIDAGHGGQVLAGGAGADKFVFAHLDLQAATPPALTHVIDYSFAEGDTFDFSALTSAFHGLAANDASIVRAVEDHSGTFATLQVNAAGPWSKTDSWVDVAQIDGAHAGDAVSVLIDSHAVHLAQIHVGMLV